MTAQHPPRILVACSMKSGSTYAAQVLARSLDVPSIQALDYWGRREQNLSPDLFRGALAGPFVIQMHIKPYAPHVDLLREHGVGVFWLRRNLGDVIVSFDDHVANEGHENPVAYIHDRVAYLAMEPQARYRYLIRHAIPWYIGFHLIWRRGVPGLRLVAGRYEDMVADPAAFFAEKLSGLGFAADEGRLRTILGGDLPGTRRNRGVAGRSASAFTPGTRGLLEEMLTEHPEDLSDLLEELPWRTGLGTEAS